MPSLPDPSRIPDHLWEYEGLSDDGMRRHYVYWVNKADGFMEGHPNLVTSYGLLALAYARPKT